MQSQNQVREELIQPINIYMKFIDEYIQKILQKSPYALTITNLIFALFSLMLSINGFHRISALFIFFSAICDYFDELNTQKSDIGKQLHSLVNIISFAIAPVILVHSIKYWSILLIIAFISFPLAGAWRLAKINLHRNIDYSFGLPISIAGIIIAGLALFSFVSPLIMIGLALLMISPIEIPKF